MVQIKVEKVNLHNWKEESYEKGAGKWTVSPDGQQVLQSKNGQPTLFYSPFNVFNTKVSGKIIVGNSGDDDYIGFALGFKPGATQDNSAKYLLVDWRKGEQTYKGKLGKVGLAASVVKGMPLEGDFWGHAGKVTELARGKTLGNKGWKNHVEYSFDFVYTQSNLKVFVNGDLEIDIKGDFTEGRIAFYNYSQNNVTYKAFQTKVLPAGQLEVAAISEHGVELTNPIDTEAKIQVTPSGKWSVKQDEEITAAGKPGASLLDKLTYPQNTPYSLVAIDKATGNVIEEVGCEKVITLKAGQTLIFKMNDEPGWYWDNTGSVRVDWMVLD
ncbi:MULTISPECIES: hypothetical protein [unclassified Coleofasciculus]|uniref:hypothetical protein n=1 Tax=unclassified Coleofasciculus TaxID=2692782 RepID=UPI001880C83E|nr:MULTISPECIES: hypothetical protein [unclassified Coleofasciculus]MBE9128754.1 hypothetical protein [Coleofasciculus sp. LEGE 07081]MBE9150856.1 hypothetical protein [Coleofasciculus sp. LEGE 07092]